MTLLPQELYGAQERAGGLLPADNGAPLVIVLRQVAVGLHDLLIQFAEQGFGSRANAQALLQLLVAAVGYPCHFGSKALDMVLLLLQ